MTHNAELKCTVCNDRMAFKGISDILGEDYQICTICLEEKMRKGEIHSFGEKQYELIVKMLEDTPEKGELNEESLINNIEQTEKESDLFVLTFGRDLTSLARNGKLTPVIGRTKEIDETILMLSRKFKSNPLLIGEPGVGKTAIVEGLAQRIVNGTAPTDLLNKRIIELNIGNLVAGTKFRGEFEARLKKIIDEVKTKKNVILFLDEFHTITGAGGAEGSVDAANILKPSLARGDIQVIGATTFEEYRTSIQKDGALSRRMRNIQVEEPTEEEAIEIIKGIVPLFEEHHSVKIEDEVVSQAVKLSKRYLTERYLPDKALDLVDEAAAFRKINSTISTEELSNLENEKKKLAKEKDKLILEERFEEAKERYRLEKEMVVKIEETKQNIDDEKRNNSNVSVIHLTEILEKRTGIPVKDLDKENKMKLKNIENALKENVKGQEKAIQIVSKSIKRSQLKLKDPNRPTGAFLFLGPTGVGKTELAKSLALELFGDKNAFIRFDMGEYSEKHSVAKLIGSPPGYVGHSEGGKLPNELRKKPFSIVLLDEIEKGHPDVLDVLLQILDDGIVTDNKGKTVDAKNAVFIITSNKGSHLYTKQKNLGFSTVNNAGKEQVEIESKVIELVKRDSFFKPEFLNRLDSMIVFNALTDEAMKEIIDKNIKELSERVAKEGYTLNFKEEAVDWLKKEGYKPEFGAREAKRQVENITDLLANRILETDKKTFVVTVENDSLSVK
ncbi:AAA family ATPase [Bacillus sp. Brlt_9]|uniref:AAA family ATPase n=1 Tax=Bacillus sp. Brlt_9 TaxID=3110916 RepID=UPI003F7C24E1